MSSFTSSPAVAVGGLALASVSVAAWYRRPSRGPRPRRGVGARRPPRHRPHRAVWFVLAALAAPVVVAGGLVMPAIVALAATWFVRLRRRARSGRIDRRAAEMAFPDAVDLLVVAIHAGLSPRQAVAELVPSLPSAVQPGFAAVAQRLRRGATLADAIDELPRSIGPIATPVATSIAQADRDGLPLGDVLDRLSIETRHLRRRHAEAEARRLPVRLSFPLVVCTLPSFVLIVIAPALLGAISSLRDRAPR